MKIADAHCDVLYKMMKFPDIRFMDDQRLDVDLRRLKQIGCKLQLFAIFVPESYEIARYSHVADMIDIFQKKIASFDEIVWVRCKRDLEEVLQTNKIGALLTLEGVDALEGHLPYVRQLQHAGVRSVGITWNFANWAADGVMEPRRAGFTLKGIELVQTCNQLEMIIDVSHLAETAFWNVLEHRDHPRLIASHSNVFELCDHPRNLNKQQIQAIIRCNGRIGITFVPWFIKSTGTVRFHDILAHIEFIAELGGIGHIGFGSDFDGFEDKVEGLEDARCFESLYELISKHYSAAQTEGIMGQNWIDFFADALPNHE